jgi:hypothetical protein
MQHAVAVVTGSLVERARRHVISIDEDQWFVFGRNDAVAVTHHSIPAPTIR